MRVPRTDVPAGLDDSGDSDPEEVLDDDDELDDDSLDDCVSEAVESDVCAWAAGARN
jgi:hypothetical protein